MNAPTTERVLGTTPEEFIAQLGPEEKELFRRADLGLEIEVFLDSNPVGIFFAHMIEVERAQALELLVRSMSDRPTDHAEHLKHHRRVELCDLVKGWMLDAISVGQEAARDLQAREHQD